MGVIYIVWPLDKQITDYLRTLDVPFPDPPPPSRNPTPKEVREVCQGLTDFKVQTFAPPGHAWQIMVEGRNDPGKEGWALVNLTDFNGNESDPHVISFDKGWPSLIIRIVHGLTLNCGPLVIIPDTGCVPLIVKAEADIDLMFATWEHTRGVDQ